MTHPSGEFRVPVALLSDDGNRAEYVEALVGSGVSYAVMPRDVLARLEVRPQERGRFVLTGGREVTREIGWVRIRVGERSGIAIVVFGEVGSAPRLGHVTLGGLLLAVDAVRQRLVPVPGLLKRSA